MEIKLPRFFPHVIVPVISHLIWSHLILFTLIFFVHLTSDNCSRWYHLFLFVLSGLLCCLAICQIYVQHFKTDLTAILDLFSSCNSQPVGLPVKISSSVLTLFHNLYVFSIDFYMFVCIYEFNRRVLWNDNLDMFLLNK
jgi:hypothetical protein